MSSPNRLSLRHITAGCLLLLMPLSGRAQSVSSLSLTPTSVYGGDSSVASVRLNRIAGSSGVKVVLSSNQSFASVPSSVTIPAGANKVSFSVTTAPVTAKSTASITAAGGGGTASASLVVNIPNPQSVTFDPSRIVGGKTGIGTLTLSQVAADDLACLIFGFPCSPFRFWSVVLAGLQGSAE